MTKERREGPGFLKRWSTFKYYPFDEETQKTNLVEYEPSWFATKMDYFGDQRSSTSAEMLPPTLCGAILSTLMITLIGWLFGNGLFRLYTAATTVVVFGEVSINVDWICDGVGECHWSTEYAASWWQDKNPYLDIPALNLSISHNIEFYEADHKTSLRRVTYRDQNGIFFGGTNTDADVPVSVGAQGRISVPIDSYPIGASPINSESPPSTRRLSEMLGIALSQAFPTDSLKYMYARWNMFAENEDFFEHDAYVFFRLDPKQLRAVKSCQLQIGLVNALEYSIFQPYLKMHDREMQKSDYLTSIKTTTKTWDPNLYDARTGTYRRKFSPDTLFLLNSKISLERVRQLMDATNVEGFSKVNTSDALKSEIDITRKNPPLEWVDWMFWISYVNNFARTANTMVCDGKSGASYITNKFMAKPPVKNSTVLEIVQDSFDETSLVMDPPFYIVVTGDMGREKMLVMDVNYTTDTMTVVRGAVIGQLALEFNVSRPSSYPSIPKTGASGWICAVNKYMDGQTCDCMCGMTDPDCLLGTLPILNCNIEDGEMCSPLGRCTVPIYVPGQVAISMPCHELILTGEEFLSGFLGHPRDQVVWDSIGKGECKNGTRLLPSASKNGVKTTDCRNMCSEYGTTCLGFSLHSEDLKCRLHFHNFREVVSFVSERKLWASHKADYNTTWGQFAGGCMDNTSQHMETTTVKSVTSIQKCKNACLDRSLLTAFCRGLQWNSFVKKCMLILGDLVPTLGAPSDTNTTCYVRPQQAAGIDQSTGTTGWKCYARGASNAPMELCKGCPWDDLYNGNSNRNDRNQWVCQYRATGKIMSADVLVSDESILDGTNGYGFTDFGKGRILKVNLGAKSGFPLLSYSADNTTGRYTVELSNGHGNHELVTVIEAKSPTPGENAQTLAIIPLGATTGSEQDFRYHHFASGALLSALQPETGDMIVDLDTDQKPFDQSGPYKVIVDSSEFIIRSASVMSVSNTTTSDGRKRKQRLDISTFPKGFGAQGLRSRLVRRVKANKASAASLYNYNSHVDIFQDKEPIGNCLSLYRGALWDSTCECARTGTADTTCLDNVRQTRVGTFATLQIFLNLQFAAMPIIPLTNFMDIDWESKVRNPLIQSLEQTLATTPLANPGDIRVSIVAIMEAGACNADKFQYKVQLHFSVPDGDIIALRDLLAQNAKFNDNNSTGFIMTLRATWRAWSEVSWTKDMPPVEFIDQYFGQGSNYHSGNRPPMVEADATPVTKMDVAHLICIGGDTPKSIFCDGIHDGLLVVEMVGFSDPQLNPVGSKNIKVLIRGSDPANTSKMEVRNMTRAYQWRFPHINHLTGEVDQSEEVGLWLCDPSQWLDGTCDCNCGRFDPDCAGSNADPARFIHFVRLDTTISVRHNCPFGSDMPTPVVNASSSCEVPCKNIVNNPTTYVFCALRRGRLSGAPATLESFQANTLIDPSLLENGKLREHDRYLWEVIEIDSPLQADREIGVVIESLMVSSDASAQYFDGYTPDYMQFSDDFSETNAAYINDDPYAMDLGTEVWSATDTAYAMKDPTFDATDPSLDIYDAYTGYETEVKNPEGADITNPEGTDITNPEGTDITNPEGTDITNPEGADITNPEGTDTTNTEVINTRDPIGADYDTSNSYDTLDSSNVAGNYDLATPAGEATLPRRLFQEGLSQRTVFPRNLRAVVHSIDLVQPASLAHIARTSRNPRKQSPAATSVFRALGGNIDHFYGRPHRTVGDAKKVASKSRRLQVHDPLLEGIDSGDVNSDVNSGEYGTEDVNSGEYPTGDVNSGEYGTEDVNSGEYPTGDVNSGEYGTGDVNSGEYGTGDVNSGEYGADGKYENTADEYPIEHQQYDPAGSCDEFTGVCADTSANGTSIDAEYAAPTFDSSEDLYMEYADAPLEQANNGEAMSSFAAELINQLPEKKVISSSIQSIVEVNLFRDAKNSYFPQDRHLPNVKENFASVHGVEVDIAMFAIAKRMAISELCPKFRIAGEKLENVFKNEGSIYKEYWAQWKLQPNVIAHLTGNNCRTTPFNASRCLSREDALEKSKYKYRLYCTKNMHPVNTLTYTISSPINLKWALPMDRPSTDTMAPEWSIDWNTEYSFTYDENTIRTEQDFMKGGSGNDFMNGVRTLWASSPYVRGRALCNSTGFTDCNMGLPANVPMLLPTLYLAVDRERTWSVVQALKAKYWPATREEFDKLMDRIDGYQLDIQSIMRSLMSTEDGYIPLKPSTNVFLTVTISISPVYREDRIGRRILNRWLIEIISARISEGSVDYTSKSKMNFRVRVDLVPKSNRYLERFQYTINDFMNDVGAWMGYMALGGCVLAYWMSKIQPFGIVNPWECDEAQFEKQKQDDVETAKRITEKSNKSMSFRFFNKSSNAPVTSFVPECSDAAKELREHSITDSAHSSNAKTDSESEENENCRVLVDEVSEESESRSSVGSTKPV